ncbi:MAG TPA: BatA domain-containing protein, partial [Haliangium sp.]|nr:BatA domain-containing protein [Haliangium sp.]
MEFLAPLMLLGAAGVAVPVIIHLIGRQRAKVVRFAAFDFLMGTRRETARRYRLRELSLLLVRALMCLAVPLILAKPFAMCTARGPEVTRGPQAAVIIIDDSFATLLEHGGSRLIDRAKARATTILTQLGTEADVAILRSAEDAPAATEL